ncbi:MAG: glycosyltransferase family 4 protein [Betaproteobacteria bacterium]|nr:glycosyltransferase family 4 protein [Betaproteobacteria bacterium]
MRRILFVAMQMSTHTARWINQIADEGWDLHLFPVNHLPAIPEMRGVTVHQPWQMFRPRRMLRTLFGRDVVAQDRERSQAGLPVKAIYPFLPMVHPLARVATGAKYVRLGESEAQAPFAFGPHVLARLIRRLKPDLIHSLEFQHCGYNVLRAKEIIGQDFPAWFATNWGSDIYYYRRFDDHRRQISRLLRSIDFYSCECERDVTIARELGMDAYVLPVMPNTGGLNLVELEAVRNRSITSKRRLVMVKGYQHFAGRALVALDAIERCSEALQGFKVVVFSASAETIKRVDELKKSNRIDIDILPYANHETMLNLFGDARVYLGVSISDAISTSMLEAMATGAFPIQTNTSCCDEWIDDGREGFIIPCDNVGVIAERLARALLDDALVDCAAERNWRTVRARLDSELLRHKAVAFYDQIFDRLGEPASR